MWSWNWHILGSFWCSGYEFLYMWTWNWHKFGYYWSSRNEFCEDGAGVFTHFTPNTQKNLHFWLSRPWGELLPPPTLILFGVSTGIPGMPKVSLLANGLSGCFCYAVYGQHTEGCWLHATPVHPKSRFFWRHEIILRRHEMILRRHEIHFGVMKIFWRHEPLLLRHEKNYGVMNHFCSVMKKIIGVMKWFSGVMNKNPPSWKYFGVMNHFFPSWNVFPPSWNTFSASWNQLFPVTPLFCARWQGLARRHVSALIVSRQSHLRHHFCHLHTLLRTYNCTKVQFLLRENNLLHVLKHVS